jgi:hypothetical protein
MTTFGRQTLPPIFKGQAVRAVEAVLDCLILEDMTDILSRNVGVCRWVTCMSNRTDGDARIPENDLKKSNIVLWPERDIFILEASKHSHYSSPFVPASRCLEFSNP